LRELNQLGALECITLLGKQGETEDAQAEDSFIQRIGSGVNWRRRFDLSAGELSDELHQHDLGIVANEPDILTKSGVFAALAHHGVAPIVASRAGVVLPELFQRAVLVNDDGELIPGIALALRETGRLERLRENLLALASGELSWPRIAQSWSEVLRDNVAGTSLRVPAGGVALLNAQHAIPAFDETKEVPA
jgi:glycosyltransferase involved in cell wall biosynthesis